MIIIYYNDNYSVQNNLPNLSINDQLLLRDDDRREMN